MNNEYIRREDAKDALQERVFHNLTDEFYGAMQVLDELEPADVAPVVHAHWIDGYKWQTCSKCRNKGKRSWKFCPNCGAKMDGGENG